MLLKIVFKRVFKYYFMIIFAKFIEYNIQFVSHYAL